MIVLAKNCCYSLWLLAGAVYRAGAAARVFAGVLEEMDELMARQRVDAWQGKWLL